MLSLNGSVSQSGKKLPPETLVYLPMDSNTNNVINNASFSTWMQDAGINSYLTDGKFNNGLRIYSSDWAAWIWWVMPLPKVFNPSKTPNWTMQWWGSVYVPPVNFPARTYASCEVSFCLVEKQIDNSYLFNSSLIAMGAGNSISYGNDGPSVGNSYSRISSGMADYYTEFYRNDSAFNNISFFRVVKNSTDIRFYRDGALLYARSLSSYANENKDYQYVGIQAYSYSYNNGQVQMLIDDILFVPKALDGTEVPTSPYL